MPGLSFTYLESLPQQIGISIDGGEINAITNVQDEDALRFLKFLPSSLVYEIHSPNEQGEVSVLILDPKGGLQALMAQYYGFKNIYKVESNP